MPEGWVPPPAPPRVLRRPPIGAEAGSERASMARRRRRAVSLDALAPTLRPPPQTRRQALFSRIATGRLVSSSSPSLRRAASQIEQTARARNTSVVAPAPWPRGERPRAQNAMRAHRPLARVAAAAALLALSCALLAHASIDAQVRDGSVWAHGRGEESETEPREPLAHHPPSARPGSRALDG